MTTDPPGETRPIIYSTATLTLCGSPQRSHAPPQHRRGALGSIQNDDDISHASPALPEKSHPHLASAVLAEPQPNTTALSALIQDLQTRNEILERDAAAAQSAFDASSASQTEWTQRALQAEAQLQCNDNETSQRSKLIEELKGEATLWRRKFSELLEEHAALQGRLENSSEQASLLDAALSTSRIDNAAALAAAESVVSRQRAELVTAKEKNEKLIVAAAAAAEDARHAAEVAAEETRAVVSALEVQLDEKQREIQFLLKGKLEMERQLSAALQQKHAHLVLGQAPLLHETAAGEGEKENAHEEKHMNSRGGVTATSICLSSNQQQQQRVSAVDSISNPPAAPTAAKPAPPRAASTSMKQILLHHHHDTTTTPNLHHQNYPPQQLQQQQQQQQQPQGQQQQQPMKQINTKEHHQPPSRRTLSHFESAKALMARTAELDHDLLALNIERNSLETELAKFPSSTAGRTGAVRRRRAEVEGRLSELGREISGVRSELRKLAGGGCN